ncbi:MAG: hypothetical protein ACPLIG_02210 [Candidatus Bathyarchaeales archaeon]
MLTAQLKGKRERKSTWTIKSEEKREHSQNRRLREMPQCARMGRIVWVSHDGKTAGIQCPASHH